MALIDLSRFEPNVLKDNRQRQVFSNEGEEVYNSLAKIGKGVADISIDILETNRKRELADYQTQATSYIKEKEQTFDTDWSIKAKAGAIKDENGDTYLISKNKFLKNTIQDVKDSAPDEYLSSAISNNLESYRSQSTVEAIKQNFKLGIEAADFNWKKFTVKENKDLSEMDASSYAYYHKTKLMPALDSLYTETALLSVSQADKNKKEALESFSTLILDKSANVDFKQVPITEAVKPIMPLSVFFGETQHNLNIAFLKQLEETGTPEQVALVKEAHAEVTGSLTAEALVNLDKSYRSNISGLSASEYENLRQKLEANLNQVSEYEKMKLEQQTVSDVIYTEPMNLMGFFELTPKESAAINRADYTIWENALPDKRIDYYQKILAWKAASSGEAKSSMDREIKNFIALPSTISFKDFNNINVAPDSIAKLYRDNESTYKGHSFEMADNLYRSVVNKLIMDTVLNPSKHKQRGYDAEAVHKAALVQVESYGLPGVSDAIRRGAVGASWKADYRAQAEKAHRKFTTMAQNNPMAVFYLTASDKLLKTAKDVYKNGKFDDASIARFNEAVRSTSGSLMTPFNRTKLDKQITQPLVDVLKNEIENGRASGDENYDAVMNRTIMKLEPDGRATVLERMLQGDAYDREMARSLIFKSTHGTPQNQAMTNAVLKSNTEAELKAIDNLKGSDEGYKKRTKKAEDRIKTLFNTFYQNHKGSVNPESVSGSGVALINYVNSELKTNVAGDPSEIASRAFDSFFKGKQAVGTQSMRGTVKLNEGENLSNLEAKSENALNAFRQEMYKGKLEIDVSSMPLTDKMKEAGVNFKTKEGLNKFMGMGYQLQFQSIDDSGKDRTVIPVFIDEDTGVKYYIRDKNKRVIRRSIP